MSKNDDIRKYLPDLSTAIEASDETAVAERKRKAMESIPESVRTPPPLAAVASTPANDVPASPWAAPPSVAMPKGALPSSLSPTTSGIAAATPAPPGVAPPAKDKPGEKRGLPRWALSGLALVAVLAPVTVLWMVVQMKSPQGAGDSTNAAPSATPSAEPVASATPSAEPVAKTTPSAEPVASGEPVANTDATAPPPNTVALTPLLRPSGKAHSPHDAPPDKTGATPPPDKTGATAPPDKTASPPPTVKTAKPLPPEDF